jgi:hypothetical protein
MILWTAPSPIHVGAFNGGLFDWNLLSARSYGVLNNVTNMHSSNDSGIDVDIDDRSGDSSSAEI